MPKTKEGEEITWKEFGSRWKEGIVNITELQKAQIQNRGITIQLIGIFFGIIICSMNFKTLWWLFLILLGALFVTGVQKIGSIQKIKSLKELEENTKEMSMEEIFND